MNKQFPNVPPELQGKMESCVQDLKRSRPELDKSSRIAICFSSVVDGKDFEILVSELPHYAEFVKSQTAEIRSILEGKIHEAFSVAADQLIQRGYLDRDQRIALSSQIGDLLTTFGLGIPADVATIEVDPEDVSEIANKTEEARMEINSTDEKRMDGVAVVEADLPLGGATSWEELDKFRDVQETESHVRNTTHEFEMMIRNIFKQAALGTIDDPGQAIALLAGGFTGRVDQGPRKDLGDEVDPIVEITRRPSRIESFLDKYFPAALGSLGQGKQDEPFKTVDGVRLRVGDFASVGNRSEPGTWKLPLTKSPGGAPDFERVSAAIQAISPAGFRGRRAQLTAPRSRVISRISSAIGRGSFSDEQKSRLRERLNAVKSVSESALVVHKDERGQFWAIGFVSNKYRDRDIAAAPKQGGEILVSEGHKEFISWLDENPSFAPHLWAWHTPGTASKSQAAFWSYMEPEGFTIFAWPLTEAEAKGILRAEEKFGPLGMSHGFITTEENRDRDRGLVLRWRTFEASHLPQNKAANLWTPFNTIRKESNMPLTDDKRDYLSAIIGDDAVADLEDGAKSRAEALDTLGVESKETDPAEEDLETKQETEETEEDETDEEKQTSESADEIAATIVEALGLKELSAFLETLSGDVKDLGESVADLGARISAIEKSDDQRIAELMSPKTNLDDPIWKRSATQDGGEEVKDDDLPAGPGLKGDEDGDDWVSETHPGVGAGNIVAVPIPE